MRYRVTFMERTDESGEPTEKPTAYLALELPDGIVRDKEFVERTPPEALHNRDQFEEDDDFLSVGTEIWDYEINDRRKGEFLAAVKNSRMVMECTPLDEGAN